MIHKGLAADCCKEFFKFISDWRDWPTDYQGGKAFRRNGSHGWSFLLHLISFWRIIFSQWAFLSVRIVFICLYVFNFVNLHEYHDSKYFEYWLSILLCNRNSMTVTETRLSVCCGGGRGTNATAVKRAGTMWKGEKGEGARGVWDWSWNLVWLPRLLLWQLICPNISAKRSDNPLPKFMNSV